jgi:hypothetical protein
LTGLDGGAYTGFSRWVVVLPGVHRVIPRAVPI